MGPISYWLMAAACGALAPLLAIWAYKAWQDGSRVMLINHAAACVVAQVMGMACVYLAAVG